MANTKQSKSLAKSSPSIVLTPVDQFRNAVSTIASAFSGKDLVPTEAAQAWGVLKTFEDTLKKIHETARERMISLISTHGERKTDAGSMVLVAGDLSIEMRPSRTGYDPKKVEALLRAKGLDPAKYMDAEIIYKLNPGKLADGVTKGKLSQAEVETCRFELTYAVQKPKAVSGGESED